MGRRKARLIGGRGYPAVCLATGGRTDGGREGIERGGGGGGGGGLLRGALEGKRKKKAAGRYSGLRIFSKHYLSNKCFCGMSI